MPLPCILAAPGSPSRFLRRSVCVSLAAATLHLPACPIAILSTKCHSLCSTSHAITFRSSFSSLPVRRKALDNTSGFLVGTPDALARGNPSDDELPYPTSLGVGPPISQVASTKKAERENSAFQPQLSRAALHSQRSSRPALVLDAIADSPRDLYVQKPLGKKDLSYNGARRVRPGGLPPKQSRSSPERHSLQARPEPLSLYQILSHYLRTVTAGSNPSGNTNSQLTDDEISFLHLKGYSSESVHSWTHVLLEKRSDSAASVFAAKKETPPLFLLLLFLRRERIKSFALGIIMRHLTARLKMDHIDWSSLTILVVRLLRHARVIWPETIPWIASLYAQEARRIYNSAKESDHLNSRFLSELTRFSNTVLSLIALPASLRPILSSLHQEKAQFEILQFMASCDPALSMTRTGFRAIARNQLARGKTSQERLWAELKGPSWPPWKEDRTAMDEEKGYDFGASRASRVLHRMYEAGYAPGHWEALAEIYAGWDTDLSPTIQTRTSLPHISTHSRNSKRFEQLLWAARVRTTRTRREAWACFLAYEAANKIASPEVYLAMFEKLHHSQIAEEAQNDEEALIKPSKSLLPGDRKEMLEDPSSPLHHAYLSEPIPTFEQFYQRMKAKRVPSDNKLLVFLMETLPDLSDVLELIEINQDKFDGGLKSLLDGSILDEQRKLAIPASFIGSFICFLCRFGSFSNSLPTSPIPAPLDPSVHQFRLKSDQSYLLEYAVSLLMHCKPVYRPAWTAYMQKVRYSHTGTGRRHRNVRRVDGIVAQYDTMCALIKEMEKLDMDLDDTQFMLLCASTRYTAWVSHLGRLPVHDAQRILFFGPRFLRTAFHNLVGADVDMNDFHQVQQEQALPPHIPDPAVLHVYVRALGMLRDYEGLYSFSTWAAAHHAQLTARANAQHSGYLALFRTLVALRAGVEGALVKNHEGASRELVELVRMQIEGVEEWGWPGDEHVAAYVAAGD